MAGADLDAEARILAMLTRTAHIMTSDVEYVAQQTGLTVAVVEATLRSLEAASIVSRDAEGGWKLG